MNFFHKYTFTERYDILMKKMLLSIHLILYALAWYKQKVNIFWYCQHGTQSNYCHNLVTTDKSSHRDTVKSLAQVLSCHGIINKYPHKRCILK